MNIPTIGQRFNLKGAEFEIVHVAFDNLRYASVAGGKQFDMPLNRMDELRLENKLEFKGRTVTNELQPDELSETEKKDMLYRLKYARYISERTIFYGSKKKVEPLIEEFATLEKDDSPPSFSSCRRWVNSYIRSNKNPMSLVSKYANCGKRKAYFDTEINNIINQHLSENYLHRQRLTATAIHANIIGDAAGKGLGYLDLPSVRTINRRISDIDPYLRSKKRNGMYQARKKYKAAGKSFIATRILEAVEADGNLLDVLIVDPDTGEIMGRPYGTCLIDKYSRCILGFKITMIPFSAATLLSTLASAISEENKNKGGLFETLIVDNGSDFISESLRNFCQTLGIRIEYGPPRDPNSKPHVERFFRTLNSQLIHTLPGSTFSNPIDKGEYSSEKYACFTLEKLQDVVEEWLDIYHKERHRGHGRSPEKLWDENLKDNPVVTYPRNHLDTIARDVKLRSISKGRVTIEGLSWYSHALATLSEKLKQSNQPNKVEVYIDSLDLDSVYVKDPTNKKVIIKCDSIKPEYTKNLSLYEHKKISAKIKDQGISDVRSYTEHELSVLKWKLWQQIIEHGKQFGKKEVARLKEIKNKNEKNKELVDLRNKKAKQTKSVITKPKKNQSKNKKNSYNKPKNKGKNMTPSSTPEDFTVWRIDDES